MMHFPTPVSDFPPIFDKFCRVATPRIDARARIVKRDSESKGSKPDQLLSSHLPSPLRSLTVLCWLFSARSSDSSKRSRRGRAPRSTRSSSVFGSGRKIPGPTHRQTVAEMLSPRLRSVQRHLLDLLRVSVFRDSGSSLATFFQSYFLPKIIFQAEAFAARVSETNFKRRPGNLNLRRGKV